MNNRILELFRLCQKAKEHGIDAFFSYSPHVEMIDVQVFKNGWGYVLNENGEKLLDENGDDIVLDWDKRFYTEVKDGVGIDNIILYLTNLIKEKTPQELAFQREQITK